MRFLSTLLLAAALPAVAMASDAGQQTIMKITKGKAKITKEFKAVGDLNGYVVEPKTGGRSMVVFSDQKGQYMLVGNLISPSGQNLTEKYMQEYVMAKVAKGALNDAKSTHWFADGKNSAPHKMYIVIDPNCIFCHKLYTEIFPMIESGKVQVRWIPVGFLKPDSEGKSAALLNAKTPAAAAKLLRQDEMNFNDKNEEGGIKALDKSAKGADTAYANTKTNTAYFSKYGFQGTPTMVYVDKKTGKPSYFPGFVGGERFKQFVSNVGKSW